jgi:hypothetical protein
MGDARRILDLASEWRQKATLLREYGAEAQAAAIEACAVELTDAIRAWQDEPLTLEQAVEESGYSYSTIQQKVAAGEIPNVGSRGRPRVRRYDLPRKTPTPSLLLESGEPDLAGEVLAARTG